tara:strand:- start:120 stop:353 length:234 start_codon:yes stop_codon:yes gene_type:complete
MKQKAKDLIENLLIDLGVDEGEKWYFHAIQYGDWLDKAQDGITKDEALELIGSISSSIQDPEFADTLMNFVHENKQR